MIRIIITIVLLVLYLVLTLPVVAVGMVIGKFDREKRDYMFLRMVQGAFRGFLFIAGTKLTVIGEENVPKDRAVLYVGNHRSAYDVLITYSRCPRLTGYVSKDSLEKVPLLSMWMKLLYCLFLDREDIKQGLKTIMKGVAQLKAGISMCIFPEGTRGKVEGSMLPFKEGSLKMAQRANVPIVPMALTGTSGIFEDQFPRIVPRHVVLEYGEPIYPDTLDKEEKKFLGNYVQNIIQTMLDKQKAV